MSRREGRAACHRGDQRAAPWTGGRHPDNDPPPWPNKPSLPSEQRVTEPGRRGIAQRPRQPDPAEPGQEPPAVNTAFSQAVGGKHRRRERDGPTPFPLGHGCLAHIGLAPVRVPLSSRVRGESRHSGPGFGDDGASGEGVQVSRFDPPRDQLHRFRGCGRVTLAL
jgi:hypothetical protein